MQEIADRTKCSGCSACFSACPKQCITMQNDEEGFLYPKIDEEQCIDCGMCKKICPVINEYKGNEKGQAYACISKDDEIRMQSSSGGVFTLLAEYVIDNGGAVFGAAFDEMLNVHHISITKKDELHLLRGSKYLQSRIENTYKEALECLTSGRLVLFSGTPCQISGLKAYLKKDYDNLILQDIICHGVPSSDAWQKYLKYQQKAIGKSLNQDLNPDFRNKNTGWKGFSVRLNFENDIIYTGKVSEDLYMKAFLNNICLRESCYNCHSKSLERESDITLADFWGVWNIAPEMFDDKGTSLVFINSEKGRRIFEEISVKMRSKEVNIDEAVRYNSAAYKSVGMPKKRTGFFEDLNKMNFKQAVKRNIKKSTYNKVLNKLKRIIKILIGGGIDFEK